MLQTSIAPFDVPKDLSFDLMDLSVSPRSGETSALNSSFEVPEDLRFEREGMIMSPQLSGMNYNDFVDTKLSNSLFEVPEDFHFDRLPKSAETSIGELANTEALNASFKVPEDLCFEREGLSVSLPQFAEPSFKGLENRDLSRLSFKAPDDLYFRGVALLTQGESAGMREWVDTSFNVPGDLKFDRDNLLEPVLVERHMNPGTIPENVNVERSGGNIILDNVQVPEQNKVGPVLPVSRIGSISGEPLYFAAPLTPEEIRSALDVEGVLGPGGPLPLGLAFVEKGNLPTTMDDNDELGELDPASSTRKTIEPLLKKTIKPSFDTDDSSAVVDAIIAQDKQFWSGKSLEPFTKHVRGPAMPQDAVEDSFRPLHFSLNEEKLRRFHGYICDMDVNWNDYEERVEKLVAMRTNQMLIEEHGHRVLIEVQKELNKAAEELDLLLQGLE